MSQLEGFRIPKKPEYVCELHKALYELKQAPHAWFEKLRRALFNWGFKELEVDTSLFIYREVCNSIFFLLVYVDDILIIGNNSQLSRKTYS